MSLHLGGNSWIEHTTLAQKSASATPPRNSFSETSERNINPLHLWNKMRQMHTFRCQKLSLSIPPH